MVLNGIGLAERGWLPDGLIRAGIRRLLRQRLTDLEIQGSAALSGIETVIQAMGQSPLAVETAAANRQHYEVPAEFFKLALGKHLKYSSGLWDTGATGLDQAESDMLALTVERAGIEDGMRILELGCGWGSLTLWMARRFPRSRIVALSNSASQRAYIEKSAAERGIQASGPGEGPGLQVITADINEFEAPGQFDRIVSVEMFEHVRNYRQLFKRISGWLAADGKLFAHVFCHRSTPYFFETEGDDDWMGRHFFTGGVMPSAGLFECFDEHLRVERRWTVNGSNYGRTAQAWLENLDHNAGEAKSVLQATHGAEEAGLWLQRWRIFFLACAELFSYRQGREWFVEHYLFGRHAS